MHIKTLPLFSIAIAVIFLLTASLGFADTEVRGLIAQDTKWTLDESPYVVTGNVLINQGAILTIEPGVTVIFTSNLSLVVDGTLVARGTEKMPITFTAQDKKPGSWKAIVFSDKSTPTELDTNTGDYIKGTILEHSVIEYAGSADAAVIASASNLLINDCTISHSAAKGISLFAGQAVIRRDGAPKSCGRVVHAIWGWILL